MEDSESTFLDGLPVCSVFSVSLWLCFAAFGGAAQPVNVVPMPRQVTFEAGFFEIDEQTVVLVSERATEGTRRAARAVQLGIRERFGLDLPIARIAEQHATGPRKEIWIIEPRLRRPPANTIGVNGLVFAPEMVSEGYFIRVDMIAVVVHGASDAGSYYGAQTLLQLIRPPRRGGLFRAALGPTLPCLWIADWPAHAMRAVPPELKMPSDARAAEQFLQDAARYRLNGIAREALPTDAAAAGRVQEVIEGLPIRVVDDAPVLPSTPAAATPLIDAVFHWNGMGLAVRYSLAALGEAAWGSRDTDPDHFRLRFARSTFGTDAAAEAIRLTEEYFVARPGAPSLWAPAPFAEIAEATGEQAARYARARAEHERRARRIRLLWRSVRAEPPLRDAFLAVAERAIGLTENAYALADAYRFYRDGRIAKAVRALRARTGSLGALGEEAAESRKAFDALIARLEAAAKAPKPPPIEEVFSGK